MSGLANESRPWCCRRVLTSPRHERDIIIATLKTRRRALGMSQRGVGRQLNIAEQQVGHWERLAKTPNLASLICWAQALGGIVTVEFEK